MHKVTKQIISLLENNHCWYETFQHQAVRTSEEAAATRDDYSLAQGAKALIVRVKRSKSDKFYAMLVLPGDKKFDVEKVNAHFGSQDIRLATKQESDKFTDGVEFGGIPPFGNIFDLPVIVDPTLLDLDKIVFNAGDRTFSIGMKSDDWQAIVQPIVAAII